MYYYDVVGSFSLHMCVQTIHLFRANHVPPGLLFAHSI
jgi:hypothetical protein